VTPGLRRAAPLAGAALGALALFPLQAVLDASKPPPPDIIAVLPSPRLLPILAFGHRGAAADLLEIRATNFLMRSLSHRPRADRDHLQTLYDGVVALDPQDAEAYWRAAVYFFAIADQPEVARAMIQRGLRDVDPAHPRRYLLAYELGAQTILQAVGKPAAEREAAIREAGALLITTQLMPGAPPALAAIGQSLLGRGLTVTQALEYEADKWVEQARGTSEEALRARYERRALEARSELARARLQAQVDRWTKDLGAPPASLAQLAQAGAHVEDPLGVGFRLEGSRVVAPGVEAARLERALAPGFSAWWAAHGTPPTAAELGLGAVAPWLEVTIDADGVTVRPRP
jgi:hypothetical protein